MEWKHIEKLEDVNSIKEVEDKLKITFPEKLKELVLKYNRGRPVPNTLDTERLIGKCFGELLNFNLESKENILKDYSWIKDKLPPGVIPFTVTPGGDYLCYDYREDEQNPKIYYWDHEQIWEIEGDELIVSDHEEEYEYYRLDFVANNLAELLNKIYDCGTEVEDEKRKENEVIIWENFLPEERLKKLSDKNLAQVNARRITQGLPRIVK